jgi:hypothetical protein
MNIESDNGSEVENSGVLGHFVICFPNFVEWQCYSVVLW